MALTRRGAKVALLFEPANRDSAAFERALVRARDPSLSFGAGIH